MKNPHAVYVRMLLLGALVAVGCSQSDLPTSPDALPPQLSIFDGAHEQGLDPHFFFLPPLVPDPTTAGTFDGAFEPVVEICELTECGTSTIASFTTTTGLGSETVRVNSLEEHYIVNWHTDEFAVSPGPTYRVSVFVADTKLGFADVQLGATGKDVKNLTTGDIIGLKDGRTLPIKFRIEVGASSRIAFAQLGGGEPRGIYTMKPDGSDVTQVTDGADIWPSWSPDGAKIAFTQSATIWVIDVASSTATKISNGPLHAVPDWSPDGTKIAFQSGEFNTTPVVGGVFTDAADILIVNSVTGLLVRNLEEDSNKSDTGPKWSPDGSQIVFSRRTAATARQIYVRNADGTGEATQLTTSGGIRPAWSPDGTQIAFGQGGKAWVMDPNGGNQTDLGVTGNTHTWSPDGTRIAFTRGRTTPTLPPAEPNPKLTDIWVMNADGTAVTQLTFRNGNDFFADWGIIR